jgi:hypothetical protein
MSVGPMHEFDRRRTGGGGKGEALVSQVVKV